MALKLTPDKAYELLEDQMNAGAALLHAAAEVRDEDAYAEWKLDRTRWIRLTQSMLAHAYSDEAHATEFGASVQRLALVAGEPWQQYLRDDAQDVREGINTLSSFQERLHFETASLVKRDGLAAISPGDAVIFLVHGRDLGKREEVARFLEKAGDHEVVILDERASRGRTLLEKFEEHAGDAKYAVVLLTGDDLGGAKDGVQKPRARQNVVFELGWFCGNIGRENITVLIEPDVERPSDIDGLVYVAFDQDWRRRLVKELQAANLDFSLDRV